MKLIFTTSDKMLSKVIRWVFSEPSSHCGMVFDGKLVIHSSISGVEIKGIHAFQKVARIVNSIDIPLPLESEEAIYQKILESYEGDHYDYQAFAYFSWRGLLYRLCGTPFPKKNAWQRSDDFLCVGFFDALNCPESPDWLREALKSLGDLEMKSPHAVFQAILKALPPKSTQDE